MKISIGNGIWSVLTDYFSFSEVNFDKVWDATTETLYMTFTSALITFFLGILIGLILFETRRSKKKGSAVIYNIISFFVNVFRSVPFLILIVLLIPLTKALMGKMTGPTAGLPALIISASPFFGRLVETGFREIDKGVLEAATAMGASTTDRIFKVLIPESLPSIVAGITTTTISLLSYTAMAGVIGAGGLGNLAYLEGFQRNHPAVTLTATVIIVIIVFVIQAIGDLIVQRIDHR